VALDYVNKAKASPMGCAQGRASALADLVSTETAERASAP
jgi:hypothetical protein